jgi:hypothetical protein
VTTPERIDRVAQFGLTERQAAFLVTVMLHSGVCVRRQYCHFAGIPHGRKVYEFLDGLVTRGFATTRACGQHPGRLFHLHHKALYRAIGDPNNRHRRPTTLPRAIERLMLLDAVLMDSDRTWLATEQDKVGYFTLTRRIAPDDLPSVTFRGDDGETVRYFPEKFPIGLDEDGRTHHFLYLVTRDMPIDFRRFLERHAELLRLLPAWRIRLVVPGHKCRAIAWYTAAFTEQVASPLRVAIVDQLRWYFLARRKGRPDDAERFDEAVRAFAAPRFRALYRVWLERGDDVLDGTLSSTLTDAVAYGAGGLEARVLPYRYGRPSQLVNTG